MQKLDATIAILSTDGFEQSELIEPLEKLREAGATVHVIAPKSGSIKGWDQGCLGMKVGEARELIIPAHEGYGASGARRVVIIKDCC